MKLALDKVFLLLFFFSLIFFFLFLHTNINYECSLEVPMRGTSNAPYNNICGIGGKKRKNISGYPSS